MWLDSPWLEGTKTFLENTTIFDYYGLSSHVFSGSLFRLNHRQSEPSSVPPTYLISDSNCRKPTCTKSLIFFSYTCNSFDFWNHIYCILLLMGHRPKTLPPQVSIVVAEACANRAKDSAQRSKDCKFNIFYNNSTSKNYPCTSWSPHR